MKTSTIDNKVNEFLNTYLSKLFFKATLLLIFVLNTTIALAQSETNKAELKVDKDRAVRSAPSEGTYYKMVLNNINRTDTFYLSTLNVNSSSTNPDKSDISENVNLEIVFLDQNLKPISEITVKSGETGRFFARVNVPKGTPYDKWSSNKIIAKSKSNSSYKVDTVLHTLVISNNDK